MAEKRRFLDVWIVELNTVYREVPFEVVCDWIQQGRLLEEDRVKRSGTKEWFRLGGYADFVPYFPKPEPLRVEDEAEALEPVGMGFKWRRRHDDEDDDPDMIPLIDVSLVLLVFFIMTASGVGAVYYVETPPTLHGQVVDRPTALWVAIGLENEQPAFSFGQGTSQVWPKNAEDEDRFSQSKMLEQLQGYMENLEEKREVRIDAHPQVASGEVRTVLQTLGSNPFRVKVTKVYFGTSEKKDE